MHSTDTYNANQLMSKRVYEKKTTHTVNTKQTDYSGLREGKSGGGASLIYNQPE